MAASKEKVNKKDLLVDPVYRKFTRSVQRALSGDDFYRFFMESIANADNQIQFSNRREVKSVDPWRRSSTSSPCRGRNSRRTS